MTEPVNDPTDPSALPLFAALAAQRPSRRRLAPSALRLAAHPETDLPMFVDRLPATAPGALVEGRRRRAHPRSSRSPTRTPVPGRRGSLGHRVDWAFVRRLRAQVSERLEAA